MTDRHLVIVGGGLAGLAAGCHALASGYRTTIVEHNIALGGVCTAWPRGPYVVDGCIHWLTGGAFQPLYEELGIVPTVKLRTLEHWMTWRDARDGNVVQVTRDIAKLARDLRALGPEDGDELDRLVEESRRFADLDPGVGRPPEITPLWDQLRSYWEMRHAAGALLHYRKPIGTWAREHLRSATLRRFFTRTMPEDAPALVLLMVYGYLARGWLSRPVGGTAAFRDALVASYRRLGGESILHATVDEVLLDGGRASGVRLGDGAVLGADAVISTSSTPETVFRLLGGRYEATATRERMARWKLFQPIVLASFGVDAPLSDVPAMLVVDRLAPFTVGGTSNEHLYVRVCNDDPSLAPPGHAVVQTMIGTDYTWWATRGTEYEAAKDEAARVALEQLEHVVPGIGARVRITDIATPLTYWRQTRSWRGAYEGWMPNADTMTGHVKKKLSGLDGFYMAGQWMEPGGGVPTAIMSGRQAVQILCADDRRPFRPAVRGSEVRAQDR
jgi:phytoene dehydrogenase-like protein